MLAFSLAIEWWARAPGLEQGEMDAHDADPMPRWTCPACGREFGRSSQSHVCAPAKTVDAYFAGRPPLDSAIFDAVRNAFAEIGDVHIEAVEVGIFFKRSTTFAELRPRRVGMALSLILNRRIDHPAITRRSTWGTRIGHFILLRDPSEVTAQVQAWMAESYMECGAG